MRAGISALLLVFGLFVIACDGTPRVTWTVQISGHAKTPQTHSFADLAAMPQVDAGEILMQMTDKPDSTDTWTGVAVAELFALSGVPDDHAGLTAVAADGYAVEIPRDDLEGAIVALKRNGEWIAKGDGDHGPVRLICPPAPANRWVHQVVELRITGPDGG
jgi:DMSO/TMAO reductase YedYZ molybdopterin-dependent catalytic subunit